MNYFVTVNGITIYYNCSKEQAIKEGKKNWSDSESNVGIGKKKLVKGKIVYTLLPLQFYIN